VKGGNNAILILMSIPSLNIREERKSLEKKKERKKRPRESHYEEEFSAFNLSQKKRGGGDIESRLKFSYQIVRKGRTGCIRGFFVKGERTALRRKRRGRLIARRLILSFALSAIGSEKRGGKGAAIVRGKKKKRRRGARDQNGEGMIRLGGGRRVAGRLLCYIRTTARTKVDCEEI